MSDYDNPSLKIALDAVRADERNKIAERLRERALTLPDIDVDIYNELMNFAEEISSQSS